MKILKRYIATAVVLVAAGCATVGPDYHAPQTPVHKDWSEPTEGGVNTQQIKVVRWWTTFKDPVLDSLIRHAVQLNPDLRIAEARIREVRAQKGFAESDFGPTLDASGSYTRQHTGQQAGAAQGSQAASAGATPNNLFQSGFDAAWEIDLFGGKRRALESANADVEASESDRAATMVSMLAEVARNYVEVRGLQRRITIAQDNIKLQKDALDITSARFKGGVASELDVAQASSLLAGTQSELPSMEAALKQTMHRISVLLGQQPGDLVPILSPEGVIPPPPPEVPVGLPSELLRRRPDIRSAERKLASATAQIGVETAELFPKFSLTGAAGLQSISAGDFFKAGSGFWSVGPTITWRIFDSGRIKSKIRSLNAKQEEAYAAYQKTVLGALQEVEDALVAYAKEQVRYRSLNKAVDADKRALQIADELYTTGMTNFLNVLDSQRSLYKAEDDLVQSDKTISQNLIALYKALGGGWEDFAPQTTVGSVPVSQKVRG